MSTDPSNLIHPDTLTDDKLAELRKSDPAAFDEEGSEAAEVDAAEAERLAAEQAEADRVAAEAASAEKSDKTEDGEEAEGKSRPTMIPKGRLNEALRERDAERDARLAAEAELAALKAGPKIDYDAEIQALAKKFNDDDDFTHDDYLAQHSALLVGKAKAEARVEIQQEQEEAARLKAEETWAKDANAFAKAHPEYAEPDAKAELESALFGVFAKFPDDSNTEKLKRAHRIVQAMNGHVEAPEPKDEKKPNATRDATDARAATAASAQPPSINGGVGNRATAGSEVDFKALKPGTFSKLSKEQQAAALGGADAL